MINQILVKKSGKYNFHKVANIKPIYLNVKYKLISILTAVI